ncbi:MAG TPA: hypothetical protein VGK10_19115 [Prolixibacteraceae bacterium]
MKTKKHFLFLMVLSVFLLFGSSCAVYRGHSHPRGQVISSRPYHRVPPGQMKKMTGAKSAKAYAPGQQKKHKR